MKTGDWHIVMPIYGTNNEGENHLSTDLSVSRC